MNFVVNKYFALFLCLVYLISCSDDEPDPVVDTSTFEGTISINPNNFPNGGGLALTVGDTGRVAQLDDEANFNWDLLIITYKTANGGRPGILLKGNTDATEAVKAVDVSELSEEIGTGQAGFNNFITVSDGMTAALSSDGVFNFDPAIDVDTNGKPDEEALLAAYANLVIGDKTVNLDEADQPVFLIQVVTGEYFKFQLVTREGGGNTTLRWSRIVL